MSTEYRRGIPSAAHVEAATRLGLLWHARGSDSFCWRFHVVNDDVQLDLQRTTGRGPLTSIERARRYRPIRPDGTPVDWGVLDLEVARVGQPATVTSTASAAPTTQPQGFRADLWARLNEWVTANWLNTLGDIRTINDRGISGHSRRYSWDELGLDTTADEADRQTLIARWTVYQELKPLYDLVDGTAATGRTEPLPIDVFQEWARDSQTAVLDAVAERRVAERMRGQTQATTVTSAQPEPRRFSDVRPDRHGWRWWRQTGRDSTDLGQRFETQDGRCRWRSAHAEAWFAPDTANPQMLRYTVIPTDEQGNPVNWDSIGPTDPTEMRYRQALAAEGLTPGMPNVPAGTAQTHSTSYTRPGEAWTVTGRGAAGLAIQWKSPLGQFSNNLATPPLTPVPINTSAKPTQTETTPLPRFTADELDDVDHSKTTKLDEVTLRRGKLPTVEQIAKYREVRARRSDGTVADALRESRIDCEVAQYVLERWAGGLDNAAARELIEWVVETTDVGLGLFVCSADARAQQWIDHHSPTLDTSEKPGPAVQRKRQEVEGRRQRLAELRQRLATERAAQPQEMARKSEVSRFDLIEPDPQADPAASICAWEARQAAAKVRHTAAPSRIAKPAAAPRRPAIEVVDAEMDGLSQSEAFAALFGRALNGGC